MYRVVFVDIDGTLLTSDHRLTERVVTTVRKVTEKGISIILASARMPSAMRPISRALGLSTPMICYNGAYVVSAEPGSPLRPCWQIDWRLAPDTARRAWEMADVHNVSVSFYEADRWFVDDMRHAWWRTEQSIVHTDMTLVSYDILFQRWASLGSGPHKMLCVSPQLENLQAFYEACQRHLVHGMPSYSKTHYVEIVSNYASKGRAAQKYLDCARVMATEAMAVGDGENDRDLFLTVGHSVAMGNAPHSVRHLANEVTLSCDEDGLATTLEQYF